MPKVKLVHQITGTRNGQAWPAPGETLAVSEDEARLLVRHGHATVEQESATPATKRASSKKARED